MPETRELIAAAIQRHYRRPNGRLTNPRDPRAPDPGRSYTAALDASEFVVLMPSVSDDPIAVYEIVGSTFRRRRIPAATLTRGPADG
jgi:hypothetical protein